MHQSKRSYDSIDWEDDIQPSFPQSTDVNLSSQATKAIMNSNSASCSSNLEFPQKMRDLNKAFHTSVCKAIAETPTHSLLPLVKDYMIHSQMLLQQFRNGSTHPVDEINLSSKTFKSLGEFFDDFETRFVKNNRDATSGFISSLESISLSSPQTSASPAFFETTGTDEETDITEEPETVAPSPCTSSDSPKYPTTTANSEMGEKMDDNEEGEDADPQRAKVEVVPVKDGDAVYSIRCKVFGLIDGKPKAKGIGMLYVKRLGNGTHQLVVRADNNLGTVILNILLQKSLPLEKNGENCIATVDLHSSDKKVMPIFIRVKTENVAVELLAKLKEFQQCS